jgi:hypothetical protein
MLLHERDGRERRGDHVLALGLGVKLARLVFLGRRAAIDGQKVGCQGEIALDRELACHVFDMRVEPAMTMTAGRLPYVLPAPAGYAGELLPCGASGLAYRQYANAIPLPVPAEER